MRLTIEVSYTFHEHEGGENTPASDDNHNDGDDKEEEEDGSSGSNGSNGGIVHGDCVKQLDQTAGVQCQKLKGTDIGLAGSMK